MLYQVSLSLLKQDLLPPNLLAEVDELERATARGAELAGRLMDYAKHQQEDEHGPQTATIRDALALARRLVPDSVHLTIHAPEEIYYVPLSPAAIEQIVLNLTKNAVDAIDGAGTIDVALAKPTDDYLELRVKDSGRGIPEDIRTRIFDPFFSTKGSVGTGLGLSSVQRLVSRAGGSIELEGTSPQGTTILLRLPIIERKKSAAVRRATTAPPGSSANTKLRILVAEDDAALRRSFRRVLEARGREVFDAENGEAAIKILRAQVEPFDAILVDKDMPKLRGDRLLTRIVEDARSARDSSGMTTVPTCAHMCDGVDLPPRGLRAFRLEC